ncbi:MAG: hypothetical protein Q9218_005060 [Villophora microphyllina]
MYHPLLFFPSLLATLVASRAVITRSPDACGPESQFQNATDPKDTCNAVPAISANASAFGVVPVFKDPSSTSNHTSNYNICSDAIDELCKFQLGSEETNKWQFTSKSTQPSSGSKAIQECAVGFWFPGTPAVEGAAPPPELDQCFKIFNAMATIAAGKAGAIGATINLAVNPAPQQGMDFGLPNGTGTGQAFREPYPSYFLQIANGTTGK